MEKENRCPVCQSKGIRKALQRGQIISYCTIITMLPIQGNQLLGDYVVRPAVLYDSGGKAKNDEKNPCIFQKRNRIVCFTHAGSGVDVYCAAGQRLLGIY